MPLLALCSSPRMSAIPLLSIAVLPLQNPEHVR
jgi:hypothetical protein